MTQKQLAEYIGISEDTVSKWSRGAVETPKWALKMFNLLLVEKKYKNLENGLNQIINIAEDLKTE